MGGRLASWRLRRKRWEERGVKTGASSSDQRKHLAETATLNYLPRETLNHIIGLLRNERETL